MVTIAFTGDVMLGRGVDTALRALPPHEPWGDVLPEMSAADLRIVNLECAITDATVPWMRTSKVFHFRAGPRAVEVLRAAGIDVCSLANNHTLDFEEIGLLDTLRHLDAAGIAHTGAGRNQEEASRPAVLTAAGARVAMIAFTDNEPAFAAGKDRPGTNYLPISLDNSILHRVETSIDAARQQGAETVVFSNHWGPNMVLRPSTLFREFARAVIDRGADIYYGHSAHIFQGVEIYRGKPILYDTGDFLDDYAVDPVLRNDWSFLFRVTGEGRALKRLELLPVALSYARVKLATGPECETILDRMELLSREMGTAFTREYRRLVLEMGASPSRG